MEQNGYMWRQSNVGKVTVVEKYVRNEEEEGAIYVGGLGGKAEEKMDEQFVVDHCI